MERTGRAILVGTLAPWEHPKEPGDRIWCINKGYAHQPNLDRLYLMDPMNAYFNAWDHSFVDDVNALDVPVVTRLPTPYLDRSVTFNWNDSFERHGISYFGASVAHCISDCIKEGVAELVLHRMYIKGLSDDYKHHKAPVGFWVGQAIGHGVKVTVDDDCFIPQEELDKITEEIGSPHRRLPKPDIMSMVKDDFQRRHEAKQEATCE